MSETLKLSVACDSSYSHTELEKLKEVPSNFPKGEDNLRMALKPLISV